LTLKKIQQKREWLQQQVDGGKKKAEVKEENILATKEQRVKDEMQRIAQVDVCFLMDCTGSMDPWMDQAKANVSSIVEWFKSGKASSEKHEYKVRVAFIAYRDVEDVKRREFIDFTEDMQVVKEFLGGLKADGGDDPPEDITGALDHVLTLKWKAFTKLAILICDAPCHGVKYHDPKMRENHPAGDPDGLNPETIVGKIRDKGIDLYISSINDSTTTMTGLLKKAYDDKRDLRTLNVVPFGAKPETFKPLVIRSITASITSSQNRAKKQQVAPSPAPQ